jgi:hypothetical protein
MPLRKLLDRGERAKRDLIRLADWRNGDPSRQELKRATLIYIETLEALAYPSLFQTPNSGLIALKQAIFDEGPEPDYHQEIMSRHRKEWPTLWHAIDQLLKER